jgi:hypothetical protein
MPESLVSKQQAEEPMDQGTLAVAEQSATGPLRISFGGGWIGRFNLSLFKSRGGPTWTMQAFLNSEIPVTDQQAKKKGLPVVDCRSCEPVAENEPCEIDKAT